MLLKVMAQVDKTLLRHSILSYTLPNYKFGEFLSLLGFSNRLALRSALISVITVCRAVILKTIRKPQRLVSVKPSQTNMYRNPKKRHAWTKPTHGA